MSIVRSAQSLDVLREAESSADAVLVLTSFQLRREQKEMIEALAKLNGESQATVVRSLIDEWRELKLRGYSQT